MYLLEALTGRSRALGPLRSREVNKVKLGSTNLHVVRIDLQFKLVQFSSESRTHTQAAPWQQKLIKRTYPQGVGGGGAGGRRRSSREARGRLSAQGTIRRNSKRDTRSRAHMHKACATHRESKDRDQTCAREPRRKIDDAWDC